MRSLRRRLFYAEHCTIGTIAAELGVHRDTVRAAIETDPLHRPRRLRLSRLDPYLPFPRETLEQYPRLRATRLLEMIRLRGYTGSIPRLRCVVARLRPATNKPFLRLVRLPGEQAQVDWVLLVGFNGEPRGALSELPLCFGVAESRRDELVDRFLLDQESAGRIWDRLPPMAE